MSDAYVLIALIAFAGFYQWLRHQRRILISRERLAALEKGVALPPFEPEARGSIWNIQRLLLLAGLCWISVGFGAAVMLNALISSAPPRPPATTEVDWYRVPWVSMIPDGMQAIGVAPILIGISHLIVYAVGRKNEEPRTKNSELRIKN